jgi:hypothetical protein
MQVKRGASSGAQWYQSGIRIPSSSRRDDLPCRLFGLSKPIRESRRADTEPLTCSLSRKFMRCRGLHRVANAAYLRVFFSLPC